MRLPLTTRIPVTTAGYFKERCREAGYSIYEIRARGKTISLEANGYGVVLGYFNLHRDEGYVTI